MFGSKMKSVDAFLPRITVHINGADTDMVRVYIMDAIIQFIRDTKVLRHIQCITLEPCINSYLIQSPFNILEVLNVRFFIDGILQDTTRFSYYIENNTFYINNPPLTGEVKVELEFCVAPYRDSEEVPDFLYEQWVNAITAETLSKLYLITDTDWYNPQAANNQQTLYQQFVRQARISNISKHKPLQLRLVNGRR